MVIERTTLLRALKPLQLLGYEKSVKESGRRTIRLAVTALGAVKLADAEPLWEAAQREREQEIGKSEALALRAAFLGI